MTGKEEIKERILENINQKKRDYYNSLDRLDFLITSNVLESDLFELNGSIKLKNSWWKKTVNYLLWGLGCCFMVYMMIRHLNFDEWWQWMALLIMIIITIQFFVDFFENKVILEISPEGLTFDDYVFNKWEDIEYLYYKTEDGEGYFKGAYLVKKLKIGYEHEIKISDLSWSTEQLGSALYQCMKKYRE
jgi:hypothetical protein